MLDTRYMGAADIAEIVDLWVEFTEREARSIAALDSLLGGNIEQHLTEIFTFWAKRELEDLRQTGQHAAASILSQRLHSVSFFKKDSGS